MAIQTQQAGLNAGVVSAVALATPGGQIRQFLYIQCYTYVLGTTNAQSLPCYVAFGHPATASVAAGDIEILPGRDYVWGSTYNDKNQNQFNPNCPPESVNVICPGGTTQIAVFALNVMG